MKTNKYHFRHDEIVIHGDSHGVFSVIENMDKVPDGSDVFHVGDLGLGFYSRDIDITDLNKLNELCRSKDIQFYVIRGNHDKPSYWTEEWRWSNVHLVADYSTFTFPNGKTALAVGGGVSVDRCIRVYLLDYWDNEVTPLPEYKLDKFDFVLAHDAPNCFNHSTEGLKKSFSGFVARDKSLLYDCSIQRAIMDSILKDAGCIYWVGGHYHNSKREEKSGVKYRCVDINELWGFDANE